MLLKCIWDKIVLKRRSEKMRKKKITLSAPFFFSRTTTHRGKNVVFGFECASKPPSDPQTKHIHTLHPKHTYIHTHTQWPQRKTFRVFLSCSAKEVSGKKGGRAKKNSSLVVLVHKFFFFCVGSSLSRV